MIKWAAILLYGQRLGCERKLWHLLVIRCFDSRGAVGSYLAVTTLLEGRGGDNVSVVDALHNLAEPSSYAFGTPPSKVNALDAIWINNISRQGSFNSHTLRNMGVQHHLNMVARLTLAGLAVLISHEIALQDGYIRLARELYAASFSPTLKPVLVLNFNDQALAFEFGNTLINERLVLLFPFQELWGVRFFWEFIFRPDKKLPHAFCFPGQQSRKHRDPKRWPMAQAWERQRIFHSPLVLEVYP